MKKIKMRSRLLSGETLDLYCDADFIEKMANLKNLPIKDEIFVSQTGKSYYIDMYHFDNEVDRVVAKNDRITFYWGEDLLSIFELNHTNLANNGVLYTNELNFVTNEANEDVYVYIFLE